MEMVDNSSGWYRPVEGTYFKPCRKASYQVSLPKTNLLFFTHKSLANDRCSIILIDVES